MEIHCTKTNASQVVNKKKKVASGPEVITAEEVKHRLVKERKLKQKYVRRPSAPIASKTNNDNLCSICKRKRDFQYYVSKKKWIQCVTGSGCVVFARKIQKNDNINVSDV